MGLTHDTIHTKWWPADQRPPLLDRLLPAAMTALMAEDRRLAAALVSSPNNNPQHNHGLAYWVFETTLVREIFKAWLPLVEVAWEAAYDRPHQARNADLLVLKDGRRSMIIEAKWWMSESKKMMGAHEDDINKLLLLYPQLDAG